MLYPKEKRVLWCFFTFTVVLILIYFDKPRLTGCSTIPRKDMYVVDRDIDSELHKKYVRGYHEVVCKCPNIYGDSLVYYDDIFVMYTHQLWSSTSFVNCNENVLTVVEIGNYFKVKIRENEMFVSYLFKDENNNVIGYSDVRYVMLDVIKIKDVYGNQIATLEKSKLGIGWTWNITIDNQNHILSEPSILLALVGKIECRNSSHDLCNFTYNFISIIVFIIWFIIWVLLTMLYQGLL